MSRMRVALLCLVCLVASNDPLQCCAPQFQNFCNLPTQSTCQLYYDCQISSSQPIAYVTALQPCSEELLPLATSKCDIARYSTSAVAANVPACGIQMDTWCSASPSQQTSACVSYNQCVGASSSICSTSPVPPLTLCRYRQCVVQSMDACGSSTSWDACTMQQSCLLNSTADSPMVIDACLWSLAAAPSCEAGNCELWQGLYPEAPAAPCASQVAAFCASPTASTCVAMRSCQSYSTVSESSLTSECEAAALSRTQGLYCPLPQANLFPFIRNCSGPLGRWATASATERPQMCMDFYGCVGATSLFGADIVSYCSSTPDMPWQLQSIYNCQGPAYTACLNPYDMNSCMGWLTCFFGATVSGEEVSIACQNRMEMSRASIENQCSDLVFEIPGAAPTSPSVSVSLPPPPPSCCYDQLQAFCASPTQEMCEAWMYCRGVSQVTRSARQALALPCSSQNLASTVADNCFPGYMQSLQLLGCGGAQDQWCQATTNATRRSACQTYYKCLGLEFVSFQGQAMPASEYCLSATPPPQLCYSANCPADAQGYCSDPTEASCMDLVSCATGLSPGSREVLTQCAIWKQFSSTCRESMCRSWFHVQPAQIPASQLLCCGTSRDIFCSDPNPYTCQEYLTCERSQPLSAPAEQYIADVCTATGIAALVNGTCSFSNFLDKARYFTSCTDQLNNWCQNPESGVSCANYANCMRVHQFQGVAIDAFCFAPETRAPPQLCQIASCQSVANQWCANKASYPSCLNYMACRLGLPATSAEVDLACTLDVPSQSVSCQAGECLLFFGAAPPPTPAPTASPLPLSPGPTEAPGEKKLERGNAAGIVVGIFACIGVVAATLWYTRVQKRLLTQSDGPTTVTDDYQRM